MKVYRTGIQKATKTYNNDQMVAARSVHARDQAFTDISTQENHDTRMGTGVK